MLDPNLAPLPANDAEAARLDDLKGYEILDTPPEEAFDRLTRLAANLLHAPIALVSLIDESRQWFKSRVGLEASETPRAWAFCAHAIKQIDPLIIPDATLDKRFAANPLVVGAPDIRFYAGAQLVTPSGASIGTLCIIDRAPRYDFGARDEEILRDLAALVVDEMELRKASRRALAEIMERRRAEARLLDAYRTKSEFLASLSHELRSPLNAVIGFASVIERQALGAGAQARYADYAKDIRVSGEHLLSLVNDILDFSKAEAGGIELRLAPVAIADVADEVHRMTREFAARRGVVLRKDLVAPLAPVSADRLRLRQVLLNLMTNAIKFTPAGGTVTLRAIDEGDVLRIDVADTGMGIPPGEIEKVLTPFAQASNIAEGAGTGLGLPISKALVERHGGRLTIASTIGSGTTVTVTLPRR